MGRVWDGNNVVSMLLCGEVVENNETMKRLPRSLTSRRHGDGRAVCSGRRALGPMRRPRFGCLGGGRRGWLSRTGTWTSWCWCCWGCAASGGGHRGVPLPGELSDQGPAVGQQPTVLDEPPINASKPPATTPTLLQRAPPRLPLAHAPEGVVAVGMSAKHDATVGAMVQVNDWRVEDAEGCAESAILPCSGNLRQVGIDNAPRQFKEKMGHVIGVTLEGFDKATPFANTLSHTGMGKSWAFATHLCGQLLITGASYLTPPPALLLLAHRDPAVVSAQPGYLHRSFAALLKLEAEALNNERANHFCANWWRPTNSHAGPSLGPR